MTTPLSVLIVEDTEDDALFVVRELRRGGFEVDSRRVQMADEMKAALSEEKWDVVISDYMLPGFGALEALEIAREACGDIPFIIVSGQIGEGVAVDALKAGADGYTTKDNLARLVPAVQREIRSAEVRRSRARAEAELRESQERYRQIVETATEGIWMLDGDGNTTYVNRQLADMLGYSPQEMLGTNISRHIAVESSLELRGILAGSALGDRLTSDLRFTGRDRRDVWTLFSSTAVCDDQGECAGYLGMLADITPRKNAERALQEAYSHEHRIADVLQRALLADVVRQVGPYRILSRYEPALDEAAVGGDFYDVFPLSERRVGILMGDVSGKGLQAAVYTAMARFMVRAYSHIDCDPTYVLAHLNSALHAHTPTELFVTLFFGVLDIETNSLVHAAAGHESTLLLREDGEVEALEATGPVAGAFNACEYGSGTHYLRPGDVLVAYTDGITEARTGSRMFGLEGIEQVLVDCAGKSGEEIIDELFARASAAAGGRLRDDAAVLVITAREESQME